MSTTWHKSVLPSLPSLTLGSCVIVIIVCN